MATVVLQYAGQALGTFVGGPVGGIIGRAVGAVAGNLIDHELDLSGMDKKFNNDVVGASAYDPRVMLKIVLLAYSRGVVSSRAIERRCRENVLFMAISGDSAPQFKIVAFKTDRDTQGWTELNRDEVFPTMIRENVDAVHLDTRSIAALYAMQRMIKEAAAGTIQAEPAQVMSVLARELDFFWKRVTRPLAVAK